jgi:hypothetical protein
MEGSVSNKLEQLGFVEQAAEMSHSFVADDDDDEEEVEPKLKYERLSNDITIILKKDAASCIAVHPKVSIITVVICKNIEIICNVLV